MDLVEPKVAEELEDAYQVLGRVLGRIRPPPTPCISEDTRKHVRLDFLPNDHASLREGSRRAFFTILASLMVPPNMPLQLFIFVSDSMPRRRNLDTWWGCFILIRRSIVQTVGFRPHLIRIEVDGGQACCTSALSRHTVART